MNKAEKLHIGIMKKHAEYRVEDAGNWISKIDPESNFYREVTNYGGCCTFYQWLACLVKITKPKLVCEMGADLGGSAAFILSELPKNGHLYSIDIKTKEQGGWKLVPDWDKRITIIEGKDDADPNSYPRDFPWKDIDLWFIDSDHSYPHVKEQMDMIMPHLKSGAIIVNHDTHMFGLVDMLKGYPWDYWDDEKKIFNNGIGLHVV